VAAAGGVAATARQRAWTAAALASQQQFLARLAAQGVVARPDLRFTCVVNGFSAIADPSAVGVLERAPEVAGVYQVHAAFPAAVDAAADLASMSAIPAGLAAYGGKGITVALLDTAVDPATPFLHGAVVPGFDIVGGGGPAARYDQRPGGKRLETHGTAMAGILAGLGGPGRPAGVAPSAAVLPIRVAGWQRDMAGRWSMYARTDQVVAGLDRAVDPDRDGDARDAARVTLIPLAEPFESFPDSPLARAVRGATALDSLVVAPAGNDGPGGPDFGTIAGPGGAPDALGVGAVDLRAAAAFVPALVRAGLRVLSREPLPSLTAAVPSPETVEIVDAGRTSRLFDRKGLSRVAGRAVLLTGGTPLRRAAANAAGAGAALVLAAGDHLPAGALGLDPRLEIPVLSLPGPVAKRLVASFREGKTAFLSLGRPSVVDGVGVGRPAPFTSWGLAFGGQPKPDVAAPGIAVATALPGAAADGRSRLVTLSGSSAAAAVAAGLAARLAQARPDLAAAGLRSALTATARAPSGTPSAARGRGVVDVTRAAAAELVTEPSAIAFGRSSGDGWHGRRELAVRNMSSRPLTVYVAGRASGTDVTLRAEPRRLRLSAGGTAVVRVRARVVATSGRPVATGVVRLVPQGSEPLDVPWAVLLSAPSPDLLGEVQLSERRFTPSDLTPAVLGVQVGAVDREHARVALRPVTRLDVVLLDGDGRPLGLLARLRDVLPGRYAFGLTGRGPDGRQLPAGDYRLRLMAWPAGGGRAAARTVAFGVD
jgi:hypothetical protein